jgi:hypothetical protein
MDLINSYCHSVYLSVLMNPANQRGWSDLISRDLIDKFHSCSAGCGHFRWVWANMGQHYQRTKSHGLECHVPTKTAAKWVWLKVFDPN